jgi:hypothetical protein
MNSLPPQKHDTPHTETTTSDPWYEVKSLTVALVAYKLAIALFIALFWANFPTAFDREQRARNYTRAPSQQEHVELRDLFETWDTQHYLAISEQGYTPETASTAFYPLWPALIRAGAAVTGGDHLMSGLLLANLLSLIALVVLHRLLSARYNTSLADRTLVLLLAFPGALFLNFPYTEALFLLLLVCFAAGLHWQLRWLTLIAAFLLPMTRPVGVLILVPILTLLRSDRSRLEKTLLVAAPLLGFLLYLAIMQQQVGDPFAGMKAQKYFGFEDTFSKLFNPGAFLWELFGSTIWFHSSGPSAIDRIWFLGFCVALVPLWKRSRLYFWLALPLGLIPAVTLSFMAFTRYVAVIFPVFIAAAEFLRGANRRIWLAVTVACLAILQFFFLVRHINFQWAA